jgi:hypothetical protein
MKCNEIKYDLPDYLNNNINDGLKESIAIHLRNCELCQKELDALKAVKNELDGVKEVQPDEKYFINFIPRLNEKIRTSNNPYKIPFWVTKFVLPFSSLTIIIAFFIIFPKTDNKIILSTVENRTISRIDTFEVNHDVVSALVIPGEQPWIKEDQLKEIHQRATEKLNETLIAGNDENLYNSENVTILIENLSDQEFSRVYNNISSKSILR